jgi:hypothetical protein
MDIEKKEMQKILLEEGSGVIGKKWSCLAFSKVAHIITIKRR